LISVRPGLPTRSPFAAAGIGPPQPGARSSQLARRTALVIISDRLRAQDPQPVRFRARFFVCVPRVPACPPGPAQGPCAVRPARELPRFQGETPHMQENEPRPHPFPEQPLPPWRRAVIKVGSSLLTDGRGNLGGHNAAALAALIARFRDQGREVLLVSSGAVAAGRGLVARRRGSLVQRQALASLGQTPMLALWQDLVEQPVAQVLLSHDDLRNRRRYLNAQA